MDSKTPKQRIRKILIANRGEIACRVIRTCKKLGISTVAVYSHVDADAVFVSLADEAVCIGEPPASLSYLNIDRIISAAKKLNVDAVHPGYGFLSENEKFAERCEKEGIIFIGPTADTISSMGSKKGAKDLLSKKDPSIPLIPGYNGDKQDIETLVNESRRIGFPVLLKASAGGGGKGMRVVREPGQLKDGIDSAKREARNSFGDDTMLIEKYFDNVRHVEIQIVGDSYGNVVHCYERECSVQRRHQKVIEESPSVVLTAELRQQMGDAAVRIGKIIKYRGAGTVEFIVDAATRNFYFLEVNTRLQVEHPVTEFVTGLDLVEVQIEIANGASLDDLLLVQENIPFNGHAIECRLYAEDPANSFFPCSGQIVRWEPAPVPGVRYDGGIKSGSEISIFYDPLICKVISFGPTREEAIRTMLVALRDTVLLGIQNNKHFLQQVLAHPSFVQGDLTTHFIDHHFPPEKRSQDAKASLVDALAAALVWSWNVRNSRRTLLRNVPSGWRNSLYCYQTQEYQVAGESVVVEYRYVAKYQERVKGSTGSQHHHFLLRLKGQQGEDLEVILFEGSEAGVDIAVGGVRRKFCVVPSQKRRDEVFVYNSTLGAFLLVERSRLAKAEEGEGAVEGGYVAPMPGKILQVLVKDGAMVHKGEPLLVMESMKMESKVSAHKDGKVTLHVKDGQLIEAQTLLLSIE